MILEEIIGGGSSGLVWFDEKYNNKSEFTTSGTFNVPANVTEVTIGIAGGGAGGTTGTNPGGGGGSGMTYHKVTVTPSEAIAVTIGAGGLSTFDGGDSSFGTYVTVEGGIAPTIGNQNIGRGRNGGTDGANNVYRLPAPLQLSKVVSGVPVYKIITPNETDMLSTFGQGGCGGGYDYEGRGAGTIEVATGYGAGGCGGSTSPNNAGTDGICVVWY